ncbi:MAG: dTDP-4-dehydrorhamnose reductase [Acidimicrobiia bacterium]
MSSSKRIAIIGSTGQLGTDLVVAAQSSGAEVVPITHGEMDVTDFSAVSRVISSSAFDFVINCAAFHRVDDCQDDPDSAFGVNTVGAYNVARAAVATGAMPIFLSSDYVFDGEKQSPYVEADQPRPLNVYGVSKAAGEAAVFIAGDAIVARVSSLFGRAGSSGKGKNFIENILDKARSTGEAKVVDDIIMSPSYTRDVAAAIVHLIEVGAVGTFHLANAGECSWYEFARAAVELTGIDARIEATKSDSYPTVTKRPSYSALKSERAGSVGVVQRPWLDALTAYLVEKGHISA